MSAADKIAEARALIEPLRATVLWGNANPDVMKAAETLDALADLADAQAQEIARLRWVLGGVRRAIDTGRNEPLMIWRDQINIALGETP